MAGLQIMTNQGEDSAAIAWVTDGVRRQMPQSANAALIASAPALLAALERIAGGVDLWTDVETAEIARAAISLAKGE